MQSEVLILDDSTIGEYHARLRRDHVRPGLLGPCRRPLGSSPWAPAVPDDFPLIPEEEWIERIEEKTAKRQWPQDAMDARGIGPDDQDGLSYCWTWSLSDLLEGILLIRYGVDIQLAPESLGGSVGWRNEGNFLDEALAWCVEHGMCRREKVPLHCIDPSRFAKDWQQDALELRPTEWWQLGRRDMWNEQVSIMLAPSFGLWCGHRFLSHAMWCSKLVVIDGEVCPWYRNTWGKRKPIVIRGSQKVADLGCFAPRVITRPGYANGL